jgi:hypothetical protein
MTVPDLVNGIFEFGIAIPLSKGVMILRTDKVIKGFYWPTICWTTVWGLWNLYYYPHLDQWMSLTGGLVVVGVNLTWLGHVFYYARKS